MQYAAVWHLYLLLNAFIVIIFLSGFGGFRQNVQQYQHVVALCAVLARAIGKGLTFQKVCLMFVFVCFVLHTFFIRTDLADFRNFLVRRLVCRITRR